MVKISINLNINDLLEDHPVKAEAGGKTFVIVIHKGKPFCLDEACTHEGGPLEDGYVDGDELVCPWHAGAFKLDSGKANENTPWAKDTKVYSITADENGNLFAEA